MRVFPCGTWSLTSLSNPFLLCVSVLYLVPQLIHKELGFWSHSGLDLTLKGFPALKLG